MEKKEEDRQEQILVIGFQFERHTVHRILIRGIKILARYMLARSSEMRIQVHLMTQQIELISCR